MKVINLYGGPGCGKSTTAAGVFSALKQKGVNCEYVHEWIKWAVWEKRQVIFDDQLYIFAKQHHMLHSLDGQVDVAICDSPLLLSNIYGKLYSGSAMTNKQSFFPLVEECFSQFDNTNIVLERKKVYNPKGRVQTEDEAKVLDTTIRQYLMDNDHEFLSIKGDTEAITTISNLVVEML